MNAIVITRAKITLLLLGLLPSASQPLAQPNQPSQYDVQAVYLFDFAKFIRWPSGATDGPLQICLTAQNTFSDSLKKVVAGQNIDTRTIVVRHIDRPEETAGCSIVFIDASAQDQADSIVATVAGKPILTVSDVPGFLERGGMIQFLLVENRVRFSVNLPPATRSGLSFSSELLKVAVTVTNPSTGGGTP